MEQFVYGAEATIIGGLFLSSGFTPSFSGMTLVPALKMDEIQSYGIGSQAHTYESKERFHSNSLHFLSVLQLNQNITILPTAIGIDTGSALSNRLTTPAPAAIVIS